MEINAINPENYGVTMETYKTCMKMYLLFNSWSLFRGELLNFHSKKIPTDPWNTPQVPQNKNISRISEP